MAHEQIEKHQCSMPITEEDIMRQAQDILNCDVCNNNTSMFEDDDS